MDGITTWVQAFNWGSESQVLGCGRDMSRGGFIPELFLCQCLYCTKRFLVQLVYSQTPYYCWDKGQIWKLHILAFQQLRSDRVSRGLENHVVVWTCSIGSVNVVKALVLVQVAAGRKLCAQRVVAAKNGCLKF